MDSALEHDFTFNEAISLMVMCDTQEEIDFYWDKLSAVPEAEQCGWLKDRYGFSWQIVPTIMNDMMGTKDAAKLAQVTEAFLKMNILLNRAVASREACYDFKSSMKWQRSTAYYQRI